jgi:hypothetical protein
MGMVKQELIEYRDQERRVVVSQTIDDRFMVESWLYSRDKKPSMYIKDTLKDARDVLFNIITPKERMWL